MDVATNGHSSSGKRVFFVLDTISFTSDVLIDRYGHLIHTWASKIHVKLPPGIELNNLIHAGIVGMLEAAERFDMSKGIAFPTYMRLRVRGEMFEYLRSLDDLGSRSTRRNARKHAKAEKAVANRLLSEGTSEQLAVELGLSLEKYYKEEARIYSSLVVSLDEIDELDQENQPATGHPFFQGKLVETNPCKITELKDLVLKLHAALEQLPFREKLVLELYFIDDLTLLEIGEMLGLTEGRICQETDKAVAHLRYIFKNKQIEKHPVQQPVLVAEPSPRQITFDDLEQAFTALDIS
jgi:RNA polymerase sigma factor FliA